MIFYIINSIFDIKKSTLFSDIKNLISWYQEIIFFYIEFLISENDFFYIKKSIFLISRIIFWNQELFLISKNNFLISENTSKILKRHLMQEWKSSYTCRIHWNFFGLGAGFKLKCNKSPKFAHFLQVIKGKFYI